MKKIFSCGAMALLLAVTLSVVTGAGALTIEQLHAEPPEFDIYLHEADVELSSVALQDITAYYDGQPMRVTDFSPASQSGGGIYYIYALDVSASMPRDVFSAAKAALLEAYDSLGESDEMALITFGNEVETRLAGGESRTEVENVLGSLSPEDMTTDFYGAVDRLVRLAELRGTGRRIGVIISDGVDDFYAGFTRSELEAKLRSGGVSINAMCLNGVDGSIVSEFGEFARLSGGELFLFDSKNASDALGELLERVHSCYVLSLESDTNITDGGSHSINFKLGPLPAETIEVTPVSWIADTDAPGVTGVAYDAAALTLIVKFTEPVSGAADPGAFDLVGADGGHIKLTGVSYSVDGGSPSSVLRLEQTPPQGDYTLSFSGITDISMEKNALSTAPITFTLDTGVEAARETPRWIYFAVGGGALALIALVIILVVANGRRGQREMAARLGQIENRPGFRPDGEQAAGQIIIPKAQSTALELAIFDGRGKKYTVRPDIVTSLFIGRHSGNDLVIEDSRVARQQAVIERQEGGSLAVQDLNSTNGTLVNGARLVPGVSRAVVAGDDITMGDTTLRILSIS